MLETHAGEVLLAKIRQSMRFWKALGLVRVVADHYSGRMLA